MFYVVKNLNFFAIALFVAATLYAVNAEMNTTESQSNYDNESTSESMYQKDIKKCSFTCFACTSNK